MPLVPILRRRLRPLMLLLATLAPLILPAPAPAQTVLGLEDWLARAAQAQAAGRGRAALAILGGVVAERPDYPPAETALAAALDRIGPPARAEAALRGALARDPAHRKAWLAALGVLDRAHPWRLSGSFALLPTSNLGHTSSERYLVTDFGTFLIDDGGEEKPGIGARFGLSADRVFALAPGQRLHATFSLSGAWFETAHQRYAEPGIALRYENLTGPGSWQLETYLRQRAYDGEPGEVTSDQRTTGIAAARLIPLGNGTLTLRARGEYRSFREKPYYDGPYQALGFSRSQRIGATRLSYGLTLDRMRTRTDYHRNRGLALQLGLARDFGPRFSAGVTFFADWHRYDANFPILGRPRFDHSFGFGLNARLPGVQLMGASPKIGCTARRNISNVALYSWDAVDCTLGWERRF